VRPAGIVLIVLGLIGVIWGGFSYTTREKAFDAGPIHVTHDKEHNVFVPPLVGAVVLVSGVLLLVAGKKS
jgi:hypothetical protein